MLILRNNPEEKALVLISENGYTLKKYDCVNLNKSIIYSGIYEETDVILGHIDSKASFEVGFGPLKGKKFAMVLDAPQIKDHCLDTIGDVTVEELTSRVEKDFSYSSLPTDIYYATNTVMFKKEKEELANRIDIIISQVKKIDKNDIEFIDYKYSNPEIDEKLKDCCYCRRNVRISFTRENEEAMRFLKRTTTTTKRNIIAQINMTMSEMLDVCSIEGVEIKGYREEKYIYC